MSGPDLHVFTLKFLALKNLEFSLFRGQNYKEGIMQPFSVDAVKKRTSKVAHNCPRPFYFTVQPRPQPTAQN